MSDYETESRRPVEPAEQPAQGGVEQPPQGQAGQPPQGGVGQPPQGGVGQPSAAQPPSAGVGQPPAPAGGPNPWRPEQRPGPAAVHPGYGPGQPHHPAHHPAGPTPPPFSGAGPSAPPFSGAGPAAPGGQHGPVPVGAGGPVPPAWVPAGHTAYGPPPAPPGRLGRWVAAGVAALVLMTGSGLAGGFVALALVGTTDGGRTYTAAPIINESDLPAIAAKVQDSVVSISAGSGEGSGVVLSEDGFILTNNHVVAGAGDADLRVIFADGEAAPASVVGTDPQTDLAVLKADGVADLTPASFGDSDAMRVGDTVLALGSPLGLQGSVTAGILSARDRTIQAGGGSGPLTRQGGVVSIAGLLQTDAPINPGNSGGALVNTRGEVIGINTAIATAGQGTGNIGVGFAIPSNRAEQVAEALRAGERISHPHLGVSVTNATDGGALVRDVSPDSPAARAGLQRGDVITRFGDEPVNESNDLISAVQAGKVGDQVRVTYERDGSQRQATVTLAEAS